MKAETNYMLATRAYEDYTTLHAVLLLHIINARKLEPLSSHVVEQISKAMIYCGDYYDGTPQQDAALPRTMTFLHSIMNQTRLPSLTVDDAIRMSCTSHTCIPVICPATTTICAIYYLNRYKNKYGMFTHSYYAAQRLFVVAYLVAAKYIHTNLKSILQHAPDDTCEKTAFEQNATQLLMRMDASFMLDHAMDPTQLCSMEIEFLHFMDYQLCVSPLKLWPWFYGILDYYTQRYHLTNNATSSSFNKETNWTD